MLGTAGAIPFSVLTLPELLLGELGAEPGALLQAESGAEKRFSATLGAVQGRPDTPAAWGLGCLVFCPPTGRGTESPAGENTATVPKQHCAPHLPFSVLPTFQFCGHHAEDF